MPHNKKQHFVPQLLQKFFSVDETTIGCYHIDTGNCCQSAISNTAQKSWYYKINETDRTSIEHIYGGIEGNAKPIIQRLQSFDFSLSSDEIDRLFIFVVSQLMRTPKAASAMGAVLDFCKKKEIKEVCEEINSGIRTDANLPMQAALSIPKVAELLSGKGFLYVRNDTDIKFLLSDNPACLFSPVTEIAFEKGILDMMFVQEPFSGYMLYLPFGPSVGFLCFDDDYYKFEQKICLDVAEEDVGTLNALEVINASKIIMYQEGTFTPEGIKEILNSRNVNKAQRYQESIYAPLEKGFSLTGLNLDEDCMVYLIHRYAIQKRKEKNEILGW
jgi:hypothetical protein